VGTVTARQFRPPRFATVGGRRLAYDEVGPPAPEGTVLLLCGIGAKRQGWSWQLPALGRRFRTIAVDYRDFGDSDAADGDYSIGDLAEDVFGMARPGRRARRARRHVDGGLRRVHPEEAPCAARGPA
jgi:pimeloyl-ACP methyl ester carboxylesterase